MCGRGREQDIRRPSWTARIRSDYRTARRQLNGLGLLRRLTYFALVAISVNQTAVAGTNPDETKRTDDVGLTIVTLGDSITKGVRPGVTTEQTFAALIEQKFRAIGMPVRVINVGIGGERTDQALARLEQIVELHPDIVTVMYGTNDSYVDVGKSAARITLDAYRTNLSRIIVELLRRGILPVVMTETRCSDDCRPNGLGENPNERLEAYVDAARQVAASRRVPLVDNYRRWSDARADGVDLSEWLTDGVHPNPTGHEIVAEAMWPELRRLCRSESKPLQKPPAVPRGTPQ